MFLRAIFWRLLHLLLCDMHRHICTFAVVDGPRQEKEWELLGLFSCALRKINHLKSEFMVGTLLLTSSSQTLEALFGVRHGCLWMTSFTLEMSELRAQHLIPAGWFLSPDINTGTPRPPCTSLPSQWLTGYSRFPIWWHEQLLILKDYCLDKHFVF